jgi:hypothetical protein
MATVTILRQCSSRLPSRLLLLALLLVVVLVECREQAAMAATTRPHKFSQRTH